jgi:two-component system chemotaxis response regulator CheB
MSIRVLVIDDSAFARKVLREVLTGHPDIEVVGIARDGAEGLERIAELSPDVITLDLVMPAVDGLGVLRALPTEGAPRVVVVSVSGAHTELGLEALALGSIAVIEKPTALATDRLYEIGRDLVEAVRTAARAAPRALSPARGAVADEAGPAATPRPGAPRVVVIGASTGGPPALTRLLSELPPGLPVPIAVVVHLPVEYTEAFARRLDATTGHRVREAHDGMVLAAGDVVIARGGAHLALRRRGDQIISDVGGDERTAHCPSVDVLFASAARAFGKDVLGVVLTGMGNDGEAGSRAIVEAGGAVITESEASCVVYGMPRCVVEAGLSSAQASIEDMAALLGRRL